jgi:hypothetical protein
VQAAAAQLTVQRADASYLRQRIRQSNAESSRAATVAAVGAGRLTVEAFSVDVSGER